MEFDEVVKRRKSVRSFKQVRPNWRDVMYAIDASLQGPFSGNHNNFKFLIVEDNSVINEIAKFCDQTWVNEAMTLIVVCSDDKHLERLYDDRGRVYSRQQAGAVIQTLLLKLVDLGLGACWVGAFTDEKVKRKLKIPLNFQIEGIIPVGYEDQKEEKKSKKSLDSVLYWGSWGNGRRPGPFEEGDKDLTPMDFGFSN